MKINISRIHNMLKQLGTENYRLQNDVCEMVGSSGEYDEINSNKTFVLNIIEGTTNDDLNEFRLAVNKRKCDVEEIFKKIERNIGYINYLHKILDEQNRKMGITDKLLRVHVPDA